MRILYILILGGKLNDFLIIEDTQRYGIFVFYNLMLGFFVVSIKGIVLTMLYL